MGGKSINLSDCRWVDYWDAVANQVVDDTERYKLDTGNLEYQRIALYSWCMKRKEKAMIKELYG